MKPTTVIAFRLTDEQAKALDIARNAQEIKPNRAQAALHFFCKGLGVDEVEPEPLPVAAQTTKKKAKE